MKWMAIVIVAFASACGGSGGGTSAPARIFYRCECGKTDRADAGAEAPKCACGKEMRR